MDGWQTSWETGSVPPEHKNDTGLTYKCCVHASWQGLATSQWTRCGRLLDTMQAGIVFLRRSQEYVTSGAMVAFVKNQRLHPVTGIHLCPVCRRPKKNLLVLQAWESEKFMLWLMTRGAKNISCMWWNGGTRADNEKPIRTPASYQSCIMRPCGSHAHLKLHI